MTEQETNEVIPAEFVGVAAMSEPPRLTVSAVEQKRPRGRPRRQPPQPGVAPPSAPERLVYDMEDLVAAGLGSRSTLYKLAASGELKFCKVLTRTVVTKQELDRYLAKLPAADLRPSKP
jgi:hypothetical protein